ncbi:hypothetical protein QUF64_02255 [Anaerolineales bacterium HSG6]|nr:hypothetical protein [Anaerolineales bacterium HSG6]MDM8529830.1 hypothetical protein [Anaerolineales bacterium HSG25]
MIKPCKKCGGIEKYKNGRCIPCKREESRRWNKANPEKVKEQGRRWYEANPEYHRRWREANPEKVKEYHRRWREANPKKKDNPT